MKGNYTILFGDVIDFGHLIQSHDDKADELKSRHKSVVYTLVERYDGKLLDFFTDSSKVVFDNPVNAIRCANELIQKFSNVPRIPYRVSLNYGNVEFGKEGIFGKPAEVTSRLLRVTTEGAVLFTKDFADKLGDNSELKTQYVGSTFLKDIDAPQEIYCLAEDGIYVPSQYELVEKTKKKNSIAVLPFENSSSEQELDYICDGIAEEIIDSLTNSKELFVTARSSSFMLKKQQLSLLDISKKLNVSYIVDGVIRKKYDKYRISFQLIDCSTGYNIVSNTFEVAFDKLYHTEREISRSIIQYFSTDESIKLVNDEVYIDPEAYSYYLKGRHLTFQWKKEAALQAIDYYKKALEIVPNYAIAYSGLSICNVHCALSGFIDYPTAIHDAIQYADKSIEADANRYEGYIAKALASFWKGYWYVPEFEVNVGKALALNPSNAEIRMFNAMLYLLKNRDLEKAEIELKLAYELDPYSNMVIIRLGLVQYLKRDYHESYNTFTILLKDKEYRAYTSIRLAWCCLMMGDYDKALIHLNDENKDYEYYNMVLGTYLVICANKRDEEGFYKYRNIIEALPETDLTYCYNHAVLNKVLDKPDVAVSFLSKAMENPMMLFMFIHLDEFWEDYYEHPDFKALIDEKYNKGRKKLIRINSETKEYVEMNPDEFLYAEAQDNYTLIVRKKDKALKEKILRTTLSHVEEQLNPEYFIRCHRSYIININSAFYFKKIDNRSQVKHSDFEFSIPVSRSKEKMVKEALKD